jgi:hypothetical protein
VARTLSREPPSSTVARLLNADVAARAINRPSGDSRQESGSGFESAQPERQRRHLKREFILSRGADQALACLVNVFRESTGARVTNSHVIRALLLVLGQIIDRVKDEAEQIGPTPLPSNGRSFEHERRQFEAQLVAAFERSLRIQTSQPTSGLAPTGRLGVHCSSASDGTNSP